MPTDNKRYRCKSKDCTRFFTRPQGTNRLYCFECRPERRQEPKKPNWAQIAQFPSKSGENVQDTDESGEIQEGPLAKYSRETLIEWAVLETWQGAAVMALANLIDSGKHGASGAAGTIKAHREAMDVAHSVAEIDEADPVESIFSRSSS